MKILYRNCQEWKFESEIAAKYFPTIDKRTLAKNDLLIGRFSVLPFYKELEEDLLELNSRLINSYNQHRYIADLGEWYQDLKTFTPKTWSDPSLIPEGQFVLKGETNSKKFQWKTHMFAASKQDAINVYTNLLQDGLTGTQKIYIREYIPLEKLADSIGGPPITREYRFFVYKDTILSGGYYWSSNLDQIKEKVDPSEVPKEFLKEVIYSIRNSELNFPNFYVIDVAKTERGDWIVIELNDGQMSGLSENDPSELYSNLKEAIKNDKHIF